MQNIGEFTQDLDTIGYIYKICMEIWDISPLIHSYTDQGMGNTLYGVNAN